MSKEILKMENISKAFSGVQALNHVNFSCEKGEVHVLAGENGAGKSTILKILAGLYRADAGEIFWQGKRVTIKNPQQSQKLGIAMVFQELTLVAQMTVEENVYLNAEPRDKFGLVDRKALRRNVLAAMDQYGIHVDPAMLVGELSVAQQQMTEILKILVREPELIILDEPTSALAKQEVERLYAIIRNLTAMGKTIIFISHRMEEIFAIGDRVTVLKDGNYVGTRLIREMDEDALIRMMIGRSLEGTFPQKQAPVCDETVFEAKHLASPDGKLKDISFTVKKGEILGVAGLQGHGQSELLNALSALYPLSSGEVFLKGRKLKARNAGQAIKNGVALVPADRKNQGLLLELSIRHNTAISSLGKRMNGGIFIDSRKEKAFVKDTIDKLSIKVGNMEHPVHSLSGGNQQKVVLGKELAIDPQVILFDEPTRGIDVEAKREFYVIMQRLAAEGVAVIMNSSDLMEVIGMSDRVLVMYEGGVSGILEKEDINEETIMRYAMGVGQKQAQAGDGQ